MQKSKNQEELGSIPTDKITQEIQPKKTCTCGACEPRKPKRTDGKRRLKIQPKHVSYTWRNSIVPQILLQGEWLRKIGFEYNEHILITQQDGKLVIELEKD